MRYIKRYNLRLDKQSKRDVNKKGITFCSAFYFEKNSKKLLTIFFYRYILILFPQGIEKKKKRGKEIWRLEKDF